MSEQQTIFDARAAEIGKQVGMAKATEGKEKLLLLARMFARSVAKAKGTVHADDVYALLISAGVQEKELGNCAGSIFRSGEYEWTGEWNKSKRKIGHGNMQRIWALKK